MLRRNSLERRLFVRLLVIALLPPLGVLGLALAAGAGSFEFLGTLGPWERVADSGRDLIATATRAAPADSALAVAVARHERELSLSLVQASRWTFLGERLGTLVSIVALLAVVVLATAALIAARSMAASLARPIRDLVDWSDALAHGRPLPSASPAEATEVREVLALRAALRSASESIADARARDLEAERVRAWGEIARRVAHEMKNPLTPLRLASHRITRAASDDAGLIEAAEVIAEETRRLDDMARQFAALGRPPEGPPSEVDIAALLAGLLDSDVPPGIASTLDVAPGALPILAHYDSLLRAFRNLLRNAVESIRIAAPTGGAITVRVSSTDDGGIDVAVADNGAGFPPGLAERIFEPDFTLKAGGTGLGLAVVRQAVLAHGGRVSAGTVESGGAEFFVHLPAAPARNAAS